jgi:hypothetical protein
LKARIAATSAAAGLGIVRHGERDRCLSQRSREGS